MNVLVLGASGYVGGGIVRALQRHGHTVTGTARSPQAHEKLAAMGVSAVPGDARDPHAIAAAARDADAVIYAVQLSGDDAFTIERAALDAIVNAFAGTNKAFIYTSGVWYYGDTGGRPAREEDAANPTPLVANRPALEQIVLRSVEKGVRAVVIRPGLVYGKGAGITMMLVASASEHGAAQHVGDGSNFWPLVHVDDLGDLYVLALEKAKAGDVFNAVDSSRLQVREIARAAAERGGAAGKTQAIPLVKARETMGPFADALALSQVVSNERARIQLGWNPRATTVVDDLGS